MILPGTVPPAALGSSSFRKIPFNSSATAGRGAKPFFEKVDTPNPNPRHDGLGRSRRDSRLAGTKMELRYRSTRYFSPSCKAAIGMYLNGPSSDHIKIFALAPSRSLAIGPTRI